MKNEVYFFVDGKLFKLKELYFCINCSRIRSDFNLKKEIEYYYCNGCTQSYTKSEALIYSYECLRCFKCPLCLSCLKIECKNIDWNSQNAAGFSDLKEWNKKKAKGNNNENEIEQEKEKKKDGDVTDDLYYYENRKGFKEMNNDFTTHLEGNFMNNGVSEIYKNKDSRKDNKCTDVCNGNNNDNKKKKKLFYFKCQYCIWSSINCIYSSKLDELIGDTILLERKCPFRTFYKNILEETQRNFDLLKKEKCRRMSTVLHTSSNFGKHSFDGFSQWDYAKRTDSTNSKMNTSLKQDSSQLFSTSNVYIETVHLNDILNLEHITKGEKYRDIFEIENENADYLDFTLLQKGYIGVDNRIKMDAVKQKMMSLKSISKYHIGNNERTENVPDDENEENKESMEKMENMESMKNMENMEKGETKELDNEGPITNTNDGKNRKDININDRIMTPYSKLLVHTAAFDSMEHFFNFPNNHFRRFNEITPVRTRLIAKKSKRCFKCRQYIIKFHNTSDYSTFRLNHTAMKYFPRIYINDFRIVKKNNGILNFLLINPLETEMIIKLHTHLESKYVKHLNLGKIPINCKSAAPLSEFLLDSSDEILADLAKEECEIKQVLNNEHIIVKKQNNMALVIMSFVYKGEVNKTTILSKLDNFDKRKKTGDTNVSSELLPEEFYENTKLNLPLIIECSFQDKTKKVHSVKLDLLFTNNISTRHFHTYQLSIS